MDERQNGNQWYHGKISGEASASILERSSKRDGIFFVRGSLTSKNSFVLCIWANNQPHQFRISTLTDGTFSIDNGQTFRGIDSLIEHYRKSPDGLPCSLSNYMVGNELPSEFRKRTDTLLHQAIRKENVQAIHSLILESKLADINTQNDLGQTALHLAAYSGNYDIIQLIMSYHPDTTLRDRKGCTPLHIACQRGYLRIVKFLIVTGYANVQDRNSITGWVALHEAVVHGHSLIVEMLLNIGAPSRPRTPDGDIPYSLAERYNKIDILLILEKFELECSSPKTTGQEWLHSNLTREDANTLLEENGLSQGLFLVRPNSKRVGYYALSLVDNRVPYHFVIVSLADQWFYIDDGPIFSNLASVISHYSIFSDGLPTTLKKAVKPFKHCIPPSINCNSLLSPELILCLPKKKSTFIKISSDYSHVSQWFKDEDMSSSKRIPLIYKNQIQLHVEIGSGEFGAVFSGNLLNNGNNLKVAVKTLRQDCINSGSEAFLQEARVMFDLDHDFIVKLIGVCLDEPIMLVQELLIDGSLLNFIQLPMNRKSISIDTLKLWGGEIACGMCFLESKRFVHRDLAARNILIASTKVVKISDFGLSRAVGADSNYYKASKGGRWPVKWYAPESVYYGTFSHSSDVWSYGITLWEMFSYGEQPYGEKNGQEVLKILEDGKRLSIPNCCPENSYSLMNQCWNYDPKLRPSFGQIYDIYLQNPEYCKVPYADLYIQSAKPNL